MKVDIFNIDKKYNVIYADPPWQYHFWGGDGAENHYHTMNKKDIENLPVDKISADNCILFLWVTPPCLNQGLELIEKWGFKYKTFAFNWVKTNKKSDSLFFGMGYYTRANSEVCLLATKGKTLKIKNHSVHQVIISKIREHSRKPDEARNRIVELLGDVPRIELFARNEIEGWDCWGNEVDKFNDEFINNSTSIL